MSPVTRKTLFRILVALSFYGKGHPWIGRFLLPRKYKLLLIDPRIVRATLEVFHPHFVLARLSALPGTKIGDTFMVRKPARYCA